MLSKTRRRSDSNPRVKSERTFRHTALDLTAIQIVDGGGVFFHYIQELHCVTADARVALLKSF